MLNPFKRRLKINRAYHELFNSAAGQIVLNDLMVKSGILEVSHSPGDPYQTAFNDGRKSVALSVLAELRWTESEIHKLALERTADALSTD